MSNMNVTHILERIDLATPESPIAVFRCGAPGTLNAVFAKTVRTEIQKFVNC